MINNYNFRVFGEDAAVLAARAAVAIGSMMALLREGKAVKNARAAGGERARRRRPSSADAVADAVGAREGEVREELRLCFHVQREARTSSAPRGCTRSQTLRPVIVKGETQKKVSV